MSERVHNFPVMQRTEEGWKEFTGREIGPLGDGIAVTTYSTLERVDSSHLVNPATGEVFTKTKNGTGFYNAQLGILVKPFLTEVENEL